MPGVREFDITGRPMNGWVLVAPTALEEDADLARWLGLGRDFALTLPAK
jgi:hypothetical protein